jgi:DNA-binding CsgD family transcriptional regulator/heme/copper-type cytochrome/quinol oxidase subunit 4
MNNIILIYNIILTIVLTIGLTGFYAIYKKDKQKEFLYLAVLFFIFILDNSTVFLSEFSDNFYLLYENSTLIYVFLDLSYLSMVLVIRLIIAHYYSDPFTIQEKTASLLIPIVLTILSVLAPTTISEIALYSIFYLTFIYLTLKIYRHMHIKTENMLKYRLLMMVIIILCLLGIYESSLYNLSPNNTTFLNTSAFDYRFLAFDIIKLLVSLMGIRYLFLSFENLFNNKSSKEKTDIFCDKHGLTSRQKEIIELIISGCSNKEIGEQLNITEGTVKTHIYNIFKKADVSNRNQIISKIMHE